MDKEQKQLIKTYFRKRGIAANNEEMGKYVKYTGYELDFGIKNNIINPSDIKPNSIANALKTKPELISYFEDRLDELDGWNISLILQYQPQLIDYFKDKLNGLDGNDIRMILQRQPQLINYFKNRLNELDRSDISRILLFQPQLKPYFENIGKI